MRITVRDAQTGKNLSIEAEPHHTAGQLIGLVKGGLNLTGNYTLTHGNRALSPNETLSSAGVRDGDTLDLISEAKGGGGSFETTSTDNRMRITVRDPQTYMNLSIEAEPHHTAGQLIGLVKGGLNLTGNYTLTHGNRALSPNETLSSAGVRDGDTLDLISEAKGGGGSFETAKYHRKSKKKRVLVIILAIILLCYNLALTGLYWNQREQMREMKVDMSHINEKLNSMLNEQTERILNEIFSEMDIKPLKENLKTGESLIITINGITVDLFSDLGLNPEEAQIDVILLKEGTQFEAVRRVFPGTSQIVFASDELFGEGSYSLLVRVTLQKNQKEKFFFTLKIQDD